MNKSKKAFVLMSLLSFFFLAPSHIFAAEDSPWDGIIDTDGNVVANDHGTVSMDADWMPSIPLLGNIPAQYHVYQAESGITMMQPDVTTLFFMAMNPHESGLFDAISQTSTSGGFETQLLGQIAGEEANPSEVISLLLHNISGLEESFTDELADAALNGEDAWSFISFDDTTNLFSHFFTDSLSDSFEDNWNIYLSMLLYTDCNASPVGCLPGMIEPNEEELPDQNINNAPAINVPQCRAPEIIPGEILSSSNQEAPNYVIVTGQDDTKRGVDLCYSLDILPTMYHVWQPQIVGYRENCSTSINTFWQTRIDRGDASLADACPADSYSNQPIIQCVETVYTLPESILFAMGRATLSQESRNWILTELAESYPGAQLYHPDWPFLSSDGIGSSHWEYCEEKIQIRDPGSYDLQVCYETSGTSVSEPRSGCMTTGSFKGFLIQTTIIW